MNTELASFFSPLLELAILFVSHLFYANIVPTLEYISVSTTTGFFRHLARGTDSFARRSGRSDGRTLSDLGVAWNTLSIQKGECLCTLAEQLILQGSSSTEMIIYPTFCRNLFAGLLLRDG